MKWFLWKCGLAWEFQQRKVLERSCHGKGIEKCEYREECGDCSWLRCSLELCRRSSPVLHDCTTSIKVNSIFNRTLMQPEKLPKWQSVKAAGEVSAEIDPWKLEASVKAQSKWAFELTKTPGHALINASRALDSLLISINFQYRRWRPWQITPDLRALHPPEDHHSRWERRS